MEAVAPRSRVNVHTRTCPEANLRRWSEDLLEAYREGGPEVLERAVSALAAKLDGVDLPPLHSAFTSRSRPLRPYVDDVVPLLDDPLALLHLQDWLRPYYRWVMIWLDEAHDAWEDYDEDEDDDDD